MIELQIVSRNTVSPFLTIMSFVCKACICDQVPGGGGGGLEYKKGRGARHLAWGVNFRFWSRLGC